MAKVILVCGRLCSGKTTYARRLMEKGGMVLLSIDEIMLSMFGQHCGDMHEEYAARTERYLLGKDAEIVSSGIDVVLDWGFWRAEQRFRIRKYFSQMGIACEMHMLRVDDETWNARIAGRNAEVAAGREDAYFVDENLARKFAEMFEMPDAREVDVYYPEN